MELNRFTDYSLRVLIFAAARDGEKVTLSEITAAYRISQHHLVKIVHFLGKQGYLRNTRGRTGGIMLGRKPEDICIGEVIRCAESNLDMVECFNPKTNTCRLTPACRLMGALMEARTAFLDVLDSYTLADFVQQKLSILKLLQPQRYLLAS